MSTLPCSRLILLQNCLGATDPYSFPHMFYSWVLKFQEKYFPYFHSVCTLYIWARNISPFSTCYSLATTWLNVHFLCIYPTGDLFNFLTLGFLYFHQFWNNFRMFEVFEYFIFSNMSVFFHLCLELPSDVCLDFLI